MSETFVAEVESLDLEGRGVARPNGKVTFIAGALPGERVVCERTRSKPSYDTAHLVDILRSSSLRAEPRCPHFGLQQGACGGCAMQHLQPRAQVAIKQRVLEDTLWHVGRVRPELVLRPIEGPAWGYRQRARLAVRDVAKKGGVLVGFHERASSYVAEMRECPVLPPPVDKLIVPLRELVGRLSVRRRLPQIELAMGGEGVDRRIVLVVRHLEPLLEADRDILRTFAAREGVSIWLQPGGPATAQPLDGDARLAYTLDEFGVTLPFHPTDFTQVNHAINAVLVRRALRLLEVEPQHAVVDFFCGLGNFTLPLARRARRVIGIEGHAGLVQRATAGRTPEWTCRGRGVRKRQPRRVPVRRLDASGGHARPRRSRARRSAARGCAGTGSYPCRQHRGAWPARLRLVQPRDAGARLCRPGSGGGLAPACGGCGQHVSAHRPCRIDRGSRTRGRFGCRSAPQQRVRC